MMEESKSKFWNWISAKRTGSGMRRWHKATVTSPVLLRDGQWSVLGAGQLWRRETAGGAMEYEQDDGFEEPEEDE